MSALYPHVSVDFNMPMSPHVPDKETTRGWKSRGSEYSEFTQISKAALD